MLFSESLKKTDEFKKVYTCGKSYADRNIVVYVWKNGTDKNHLGISVSKKVGNSIVRHRFARNTQKPLFINTQKEHPVFPHFRKLYAYYLQIYPQVIHKLWIQ